MSFSILTEIVWSPDNLSMSDKVKVGSLLKIQDAYNSDLLIVLEANENFLLAKLLSSTGKWATLGKTEKISYSNLGYWIAQGQAKIFSV